MKKLYSFCLGKYLGPRFENSFIELFSYDGSKEEDRLGVSRQIKTLVPEDKHGVTDFDLWVRLSNPVIRIYVDTAVDPMYRAFVTIPHELEHALGTGVLRRAMIDFKMKDISPGCETMARISGVITYKFQNAYLKEVGLTVKSEEKSGQ